MGVSIKDLGDERVLVKRKGRMRAVNFSTRPYPGFPTDFQAQMMVLQTIAKGTSIIEETIFENRFRHVPELVRMGANIESASSKAVVIGGDALRGCPVMASDLQAGASLLLAGLAGGRRHHRRPRLPRRSRLRVAGTPPRPPGRGDHAREELTPALTRALTPGPLAQSWARGVALAR